MKTILIVLVISSTSFSLKAAEHIKIIVNANNSIQTITTSQIQDFFLKRARTWPDGTPVRFFDRSDDSPERKIFLQNYLKRTARQVEQHWIGQKLYSGDSSPSQVTSDSLMVSLVSRFPGGIGYVSAYFSAGKGVKIIEVNKE